MAAAVAAVAAAAAPAKAAAGYATGPVALFVASKDGVPARSRYSYCSCGDGLGRRVGGSV